MRFLPIFLLSLLFHSTPVWETDFEKAIEKARTEHKLVLLNFSGSDWCIPCIRLHKEIFESNSFKEFADSNLILVNADFPRLKKHQLSKDQQKQNDKLADKYDPQGSFPYTVIMDEKGKVLKGWEGYPNMSPEQFIVELKTYVDSRK
jgi:thioredoxin-related protein